MPVEFVIAWGWCCNRSHLGKKCLAFEKSLLTFSKVNLESIVSSWHPLLGQALQRVVWSQRPWLSALLYLRCAGSSTSLPEPVRGGPWEITGWVCSALSAALGMRVSPCGWTTCILFFSSAKRVLFYLMYRFVHANANTLSKLNSHTKNGAISRKGQLNKQALITRAIQDWYIFHLNLRFL